MRFELAWLGLVAPPTSIRLANAHWAPDEPDAYCARCGTTIPSIGAVGGACPACRGAKLPWDAAVRIGEYRGVLRDLIHDFKFTRWRRVGGDLGSMLGAAVRDRLRRAAIDPRTVAIVPIPTTIRRRLARGIDHTLVLARAVAEETGGTLVRMLSRAHRRSQVALPLAQRRTNVRGSFRRLPTTHPGGWRVVILVDDIRTTGATMSAACRALTQGIGEGETQIWAAVVAVTPERRGDKSGA